MASVTKPVKTVLTVSAIRATQTSPWTVSVGRHVSLIAFCHGKSTGLLSKCLVKKTLYGEFAAYLLLLLYK